MASWMIHLRITEGLLENINNLDEQTFIMGNLAPDSGVPNKDYTAYTPHSWVSHFKEEGKTSHTDIHPEWFVEQFLTEEQIKNYTKKQYSFYLGYLCHLLTDMLWGREIWHPCKELHKEELEENKDKFVRKVKGDWYDLNFLYLKKHPDFSMFQSLKEIGNFENTFMEIFQPNAFEDRKNSIIEFYERKKEGLEREYPYLTKERADNFVTEGVVQVLKALKAYGVIDNRE